MSRDNTFRYFAWSRRHWTQELHGHSEMNQNIPKWSGMNWNDGLRNETGMIRYIQRHSTVIHFHSFLFFSFRCQLGSFLRHSCSFWYHSGSFWLISLHLLLFLWLVTAAPMEIVNIVCRLPIVQGGGSLAFVSPALSILALPKFLCPKLEGQFACSSTVCCGFLANSCNVY